MKVIPLAATASPISCVATRRPSAWLINSSSPVSKTGARFRLMASTFRGSASTPMTRRPLAAKHAASGAPSLPNPITEMAFPGFLSSSLLSSKTAPILHLTDARSLRSSRRSEKTPSTPERPRVKAVRLRSLGFRAQCQEVTQKVINENEYNAKKARQTRACDFQGVCVDDQHRGARCHAQSWHGGSDVKSMKRLVPIPPEWRQAI